MLTLPGCQTVPAVDGKEAIEMAQKEEFNAFLMYYRMPELDGFNATRIIGSWESPKSQTPIIAWTANASAEDKELAKQSGMDSFPTKPVLMEDLRRELSKFSDAAPSRNFSESPTKALSTLTYMDKLTNIQTLDSGILKKFKHLEDPGVKIIFRCSNQHLRRLSTRSLFLMKKSYRGTECRSIEIFSHKLKGFSRNLGATRLIEISDVTEKNTRTVLLKINTEIIKLVKEEFDLAKVELNLRGCKNAARV